MLIENFFNLVIVNFEDLLEYNNFPSRILTYYVSSIEPPIYLA